MKSRISKKYILFIKTCCVIAITITVTGCHLEKRHVCEPGDKIVISSVHVNGTGTVIQVEFGSDLDRECDQNALYYQIQFGSITNTPGLDNVLWVSAKSVRRLE